MQIIVDHYNPQRIYTFSSSNTILASNDQGTNWSLLYETRDYPLKAQINSQDSRILYVLDNEGNLYRTTDAGATWVVLNSDDFNDTYDRDFPDAENIKDFTLDYNNPQTIYTSSEQGLLRSQDQGLTWVQVNTPIAPQNEENERIKNLTVAPGQSSTIYFTINNLVYKSTDSGSSWKIIEDFPSVREITDLEIDPQNSSIIYAGSRIPPEEDKGFI